MPIRHLDPKQLADVAGMDQAMAEAADDLRLLIEHATANYGDLDETRATADYAQGLLGEASWQRMELVSVLALAVVRLARRQTDG